MQRLLCGSHKVFHCFPISFANGPGRLRWCNFTERQNFGVSCPIFFLFCPQKKPFKSIFGISIDMKILKFTALVFNTVRYNQCNFKYIQKTHDAKLVFHSFLVQLPLSTKKYFIDSFSAKILKRSLKLWYWHRKVHSTFQSFWCRIHQNFSTNTYRLLRKYREIFPTLVVVRHWPELARARVRTTTKGGNISRYLVNNLFIVYPWFLIMKLWLINLKSMYSKPQNYHNLSIDWIQNIAQ